MASKYVTEPVVSSLSGDVVAPSGAIVLSEGVSDALPLVYYGTVAAPNTDPSFDDIQFAVASGTSYSPCLWLLCDWFC